MRDVVDEGPDEDDQLLEGDGGAPHPAEAVGQDGVRTSGRLREQGARSAKPLAFSAGEVACGEIFHRARDLCFQDPP